MDPVYEFSPIFSSRDCRYGRMIFPTNDEYVGRSLNVYGEFSEGEAELFRHFIRPGATVVEAGANIGAHTVFLARLAGASGALLAFEPQRVLFQVMCANLALNNIVNVVAEQKGLGRKAGSACIPRLDYGAALNFGGLSLDMVTEGEWVKVVCLDSYQLPRCDFIKVDVEGMEQEVLEGAARTIHLLRPVMYVENDRRGKSHDLIELLHSMEYRLFWHRPPLFNRHNFAGYPEDVFEGVVSQNLLCLPPGLACPMDLLEIGGPDEWPFGTS